MKELKDYLPFHLGCKISDGSGNIRTLDTAELDYALSAMHYDWKPQLRPMNTINNTEFTEYLKQGKEYAYSAFGRPSLQAERTRWLCANDFDVFNLIEAGLAEIKENVIA